jgi:hypothetical protein
LLSIGLIFNSYSRENSVESNILFQEKEWQDELDLDVYDFDWRQYDSVIDRPTMQKDSGGILRVSNHYTSDFITIIRKLRFSRE